MARGSTETPKNQDTAQSFQRTLQVGHCLIASGPAALSVGFCTVAIVTPTERIVGLTPDVAEISAKGVFSRGRQRSDRCRSTRCSIFQTSFHGGCTKK